MNEKKGKKPPVGSFFVFIHVTKTDLPVLRSPQIIKDSFILLAPCCFIMLTVFDQTKNTRCITRCKFIDKHLHIIDSLILKYTF